MLKSSSLTAIGGALARLSGRPGQPPAGLLSGRTAGWRDGWEAARALVVFPCSGFEFMAEDGTPVAWRYLDDDRAAWPLPDAPFLNGALARAAGSPADAASIISDADRRKDWLEGWGAGGNGGWHADDDGCPLFPGAPASKRLLIQLAAIFPHWQLPALGSRLGHRMPTGSDSTTPQEVKLKNSDGSSAIWFVPVGPEGTFPTMFPFRYQAQALSEALFRRWNLAREIDDVAEARWLSDPADELTVWEVKSFINHLDGQGIFLVTGPRGWLAHAFEDKETAREAMRNLQNRISHRI